MNIQPFSINIPRAALDDLQDRLARTPLALAMFRDDWRTLRRLAEQAHNNIIHWVEYDTGGHYAAHQVPELFVGDVRKFFRSLHR